MKFLKAIFRVLTSLKLAVVVLVALSCALAVGTILESLYDISTGRYWVYRALWFHALLFLLGLNILCVALSRFPWKPRHTPFLLAHLGILTLLWGSWLTQEYGVDGTMPVEEGTSSSRVTLENTILYVRKGEHTQSIEIPWIPPTVDFTPTPLDDLGITVDRYITHAELAQQFVDSMESIDSIESKEPSGVTHPAIQFELKGGPFNISERFWLWTGAKEWKQVRMGPAVFSLHSSDASRKIGSGVRKTAMEFFARKDGGFDYRIFSRKGTVKKGSLSKKDAIGKKIDVGWMGMQVRVRKWLPKAENRSHYVPARVQYGDRAPRSAIRVKGESENAVWIFSGERKQLEVGGEQIDLIYGTKQVALPFAIELERFRIKHQPGNREPASYSSLVKVRDRDAPNDSILISMNEPLEWNGYTFYQASYVPGEPRPTTSVFSVNQDPGRWLKYIGSILIVLGSILLFAMKYVKKRSKGTV